MKKYYFLIIVVLILSLVLTGCSLLSNISQVPANEQSGIAYSTKGGPTENEAESFPLYAGQDWLVGEVLVWNDDTQLCVKYQLDPDIFAEGWGITETHLAVAGDLSGIPQTKPKKGANSGNPIPGKFPYGDDNLPGVEEDGPYCIPFGEEEGQLNVDCGDTVFIAAHAVIEKCVTVQDTLVPVLTWTRSSELDVAVFPGYGAQWTQAQGFTISTPELFVWDGGELGQYFTGYSSRTDINWASWICTQNASGKSLTGTDLRRFNATFNIPEGCVVTGATLGSVNSGYEDVIPMNDNIYIFMNEELIFWGGTISIAGLDPYRDTFLGEARRNTEPQNKPSFPETDGWHMNGSFPAVPSGLFIVGLNNLDVFAEELWTGGGMHELFLTLQVEQTTCESETAWAGTGEGTIQFTGANWATYFEYLVTCPTPICIDFSNLDFTAGDSIEGASTVYDYLNIDAVGGDAVFQLSGVTPNLYGAPNGVTSVVNGCMDLTGGFGDEDRVHEYIFTFGDGKSVSEFSLHMLDFGDLNPGHATHHLVTMTAYSDVAGTVEVDTDILEYNSDSKTNPTTSPEYGNLYLTGDACTATTGQPGNWTWEVSGTGIVRIELTVNEGRDPNIAFDLLCFTIEQH